MSENFFFSLPSFPRIADKRANCKNKPSFGSSPVNIFQIPCILRPYLLDRRYSRQFWCNRLPNRQINLRLLLNDLKVQGIWRKFSFRNPRKFQILSLWNESERENSIGSLGIFVFFWQFIKKFIESLVGSHSSSRKFVVMSKQELNKDKTEHHKSKELWKIRTNEWWNYILIIYRNIEWVEKNGQISSEIFLIVNLEKKKINKWREPIISY